MSRGNKQLIGSMKGLHQMSSRDSRREHAREEKRAEKKALKKEIK